MGDIIADRYIYGKTSRISREAPVLILKFIEEVMVPGQAGNVVRNLAALGCGVIPAGILGDDPEGRGVRNAFEQTGVECSGIMTDPRRKTLNKTRILAGGHHTSKQQVIRIDYEDGDALETERERETIAFLERISPKVDGFIVSDYGCGMVSAAVWETVKRLAAGRFILLDSRHRLAELTGASIITPNEEEAYAALGLNLESRISPEEICSRLRKLTGCRGIVFTRGSEGMFVLDEQGAQADIGIFGTDENTDVTGAGDTVVSMIAASLASGAGLIEAAHMATVAAGIVVTKRGTATVSPDEIIGALETEALD